MALHHASEHYPEGADHPMAQHDNTTVRADLEDLMGKGKSSSTLVPRSTGASKISGAPCLENASSAATMQKAVPGG